jgi:hypothetical protein
VPPDVDLGPTLGSGCPAISDACNATPLAELGRDNPKLAKGAALFLVSVGGGEVGEAAVMAYRAGKSISDIAQRAPNPIERLPRVGSALKQDPYHAFPDIVDNYASLATETSLPDGADLFQLSGSLNGKAGRFE